MHHGENGVVDMPRVGAELLENCTILAHHLQGGELVEVLGDGLGVEVGVLGQHQEVVVAIDQILEVLLRLQGRVELPDQEEQKRPELREAAGGLPDFEELLLVLVRERVLSLTQLYSVGFCIKIGEKGLFL